MSMRLQAPVPAARGRIATEELETRVREFLCNMTQLPRSLPRHTDLVGDAGICGDDIPELLEEFGEEFGVAFEDYRWYHHIEPRGYDPLWIIFRPWWTRKTHVPIRLIDLFESARCGTWTINYPDGEREL